MINNSMNNLKSDKLIRNDKCGISQKFKKYIIQKMFYPKMFSVKEVELFLLTGIAVFKMYIVCDNLS